MMQDYPLVSIIVVTYNSSKYVLETLESAKAQTYQNIELIITDDCSTDNTVEICSKWIAENNERFKRTELLTTNINRGIPANCNRGVKAAFGKWIKFVAGDDILLPSCLTDNIDYISIISGKIFFSKMEAFKIDLNGNFSKWIIPEAIPSTFSKNVTAKEQFKILLLYNALHFAPSIFIKKSIFDEVGYFDEEFPLIEDYPFWLKITSNGIKVHFINKLTVRYRVHEDSVQNRANFEKVLINESFFLYEEIRKKYIYPYFSKPKLFSSVYQYHLSKLFRYADNNRINQFLFKSLNYYFNPFVWYLFIFRNILRIKDVNYRDDLRE